MAELATLVDRRAVMADLVLLDGECISEDGIISALKDRYERDEIYTNIGDVVVSINPFHLLAIYGEEHMRAYNVKSDMVFRLSPHIFSLANAAYRNLKAFRTDQVVLITGESGSGKTEAAKIIMRYLASVSGSEAHASHIKVQLLQSNPVMEAFGNARTLRNGNSSRFGKYMDMQFNYAAEAVGGEITSYLLEKSRVVFQAEGERSFHMFYYLLAGAEEGLLDFLGLQRDAGAYQLLSRSGSHLIDQQDHDAGMFRRLIKSCQAVGFSSESVQMLLELTAAILHLGNVEVAEETTSDGNDYVFIRPSDSFGHAAARLCITPEQLATAFTRRTVSSSGESFLVSLTLDQAIFARGSMCKAIYERMFKLIVHTINRKIKVDPSVCVPSDVRRLGVLDIYGFEVFPANAFEQLCINYCNEKLQQLFVSLTIEREQQLYISEGLDWVQIDYFNNKAICALLENTPNGIFPTLDEQGLLQNDSDTVFLEELTSRNQNDPHYETRKGNNKEFTVHHYAGAVTYQIEGMIRKNNDTLFKDISRAMFRSSNATVSSLFPEGGFSDAELMKRPVGAAIQFKRSINELRANIASKQPHYIRCVKPNDDQAPHTFDWTTIAMQVQYLGMLENVRVARAGFAFREDTTWFEMRYRCLCIPRLFPRTPAHMTSAEAVALILHEAKIPSSAYVVGRTKVFFREPQHIEQLERLRDKTRPYMVRLIQPFYRGWRVRREYWKMRRAARTIQVAWKVRRYLPIYEPMRVLYHAYLAFTKLGKLKEAYMEPNEWTKPNEAEFITQNAVPRVAAYTIQWAWRRYKMRLMVKHMLMHMRSTRRLGWVKGNKTEMESWPDACGPRGQTFLTLMQTRFALWSAREYRRACTVQQQAMLILKAQCSDLFLGNKANYYRSINKVFRPNSFNIKEEKNYRKWEKLFPVGGYEKVHFANIVVKIKRSDFKRHSRILTMTNKHLYILDPSFKVKATIPFDAVSEVSVSPYQDNVFVLHLDMKEMHGNQERKGDFMFMSDELCEIITKLSMQYKFATRFQLKINFSKVISVRLKPPNFKRIRFSLSRTTHVSSFINKAGDMEMVCPDTAEHILAADRDTLRRTRSNEAVITNGAFARKVPMERYDSVVGDIADLMNEQQYARFMETGTLPRNFEFKTTEDALLE